MDIMGFPPQLFSPIIMIAVGGTKLARNFAVATAFLA
jgi:hypothetical protein